jgi:diguanylate cyclase (GGDEF)-like protein/PAS domain S-box-containing protein
MYNRLAVLQGIAFAWRMAMEAEGSPRSRFAEELDLLRKQIAELKGLILETGPVPALAAPESSAARRALERIKAEIASQLGTVPACFAPVQDMPEILALLWQQMRSCYLKNPIPALAKEKLFARLSLFCPVAYSLHVRMCGLRQLGMNAEEIRQWLERPAPGSEEDLAPAYARLASGLRAPPGWPEPGSSAEEDVLDCAIYLFLHRGRSERCRQALMESLGSVFYARLVSFLMYVRMHHSWLEVYPEPDLEQEEAVQSGLRALLEAEPRLAAFLKSCREDMSRRELGHDSRCQDESFCREKQICSRIFSDSQDGIFTFDRELVCTLWNPAMEKMFGIPGGDAVGRMIFELMPLLVETGDSEHLPAVLQGETITVRDRPYRIEGSAKEGYCDIQYGPLFNGTAHISGGIAFVRDTTERRKAEQGQRTTERRYLELFENANDIVYSHDLDGNLTSVNKAAERITGYARSETLLMNLSQLVAPEHFRTVRRNIERQVAGDDPAPFEIDVLCKDGRRVALEVNARIISKDGKPVGVQGIARDITERKKTEDALQQAKKNLEAWVHELEQRTREMTLLSEMGDMLRACLTTDEAHTVIVRVAQQIFPVQSGALYVISPARNLVEAVAVWGDPTHIERVFSPEECWALRRGRVHWVEDARVGLVCKHLHHPPPESYLCVPMMAQSQALGILLLTQPPNARLTEAKQRLALAMAEHIAMALSNLKLHETLRSQSIRDPLSGLFNRRFMEESLELELRRSARNRRPLGMIALEVDGFHDLGRAYGEDAENTVLIEIGKLLQTIVRKEDIVCRFGDEKFAILLPQASLEVTAQRAESLRDMAKNLEILHREHLLNAITFSAGIAGFPDHGRTAEALIRAADAALQRALRDGGDRVIVPQ